MKMNGKFRHLGEGGVLPDSLLSEAHQSAQGGPMSPPQHHRTHQPHMVPGHAARKTAGPSALSSADEVFQAYWGLSWPSTPARKGVQMGHYPVSSRATPVQGTSNFLCFTWAWRDAGGHTTGGRLSSATSRSSRKGHARVPRTTHPTTLCSRRSESQHMLSATPL